MITVLIIEDNVTSRESLRQTLSARCHDVRVQEADNGKEALEAVERSQPDVILMNMRLPDLNGIEVLREIRRQSGRVIVVAFSHDDTPEYREVSLSCGADYFVCMWSSSPAEIDSVLETVFLWARAMADARYYGAR